MLEINIIFLFILALVWIIFATIQDLRNKEIANWLNFSLIIFALGFRLFYCLFFGEGNFSFFFQGLIGFAIFLILGNLLYLGRMFAGGDAKLLIALGAVIPLSETFLDNLTNFSMFFILFLIAGAIYGISASIFLALKNLKNLKKEFIKNFNKYKMKLVIPFVLGLMVFVFSLFERIFLFIGILFLIYPFLFLFARSIEEACMIKEINSNRLREGDWLYKDLKIGGKIIKARWEGLSKKEIQIIKKSKKKIWIREGIAFSPVFLISFVIFMIFKLLNIDLWNALW